MGRKVQIRREQILDAALQMIVDKGYESINIKTLAEATGCSTQPIVSCFDNMDNFRAELQEYALAYLNQETMGDGVDPLKDFEKLSMAYIDAAIDKPNLIRYIRLDDKTFKEAGGINVVFNDEKNVGICSEIAAELGTTVDVARDYVKSLMIHTEGVVSLYLSGATSLDRDAAHNLVKTASDIYIEHIKNGKK